MNYVSVDEASKRGHSEKFFENVRKAVLPKLVEAGRLKGETRGGTLTIADDDALREVLGYGAERFVYNQQGFSFVAVEAPFDRVSDWLIGRPGTIEHAVDVKVGKSAEGMGVRPDEDRRQTFLVQARGSRWPVLVQTVHWFMNVDALLATALAAEASAALKTRAMAAWDDDFSGSSMIVCEDGQRVRDVTTEGDDWEVFYRVFYEEGVAAPACFISTPEEGGAATLHADRPEEIERAAYFVLPVPAEVRSSGPHVFEKLGLMAEAVAADIEDEEAFMGHMLDGIWERAQGVIRGQG